MCTLQVKQADLKYVDPAAREAAAGARAALGPEYELQLRSEAGPMPGKLAKRKHQISSLYHNAKIRVGQHATSVHSPVWGLRFAEHALLTLRLHVAGQADMGTVALLLLLQDG